MRAYAWFWPGLAVVALAGAAMVGPGVRPRPVSIDPQRASLTVRADVMRFFAVGMKRAVADVLWVQTLLDSDLTHYAPRDLRSWMFLRFQAITRLDPRFYEAYRYGGQYLSIIKDDLQGARQLMGEGLKLFPDDYALNWQMGFLLAVEMDRPREAYPYFERIKDHPQRPPFFETLFTKITAEHLGDEEAFLMALEIWKGHPADDTTRRRLGEYLYSLRAAIDLGCLNAGGPACARRDFAGLPYLRAADGTWRSARPIKPVRLKRKAKPGAK